MQEVFEKEKIPYRSTGLKYEMLIENRTKESKDEMKLKL
jgi:hypothetical protein